MKGPAALAAARSQCVLPLQLMWGNRHLIFCHDKRQEIGKAPHGADEQYRACVRVLAGKQTCNRAPAQAPQHAPDELTLTPQPCTSPYETSTVARMTACSRPSNRSLCPSSVLKSALPASTSPATLGRSLVMNICTASSATLRT